MVLCRNSAEKSTSMTSESEKWHVGFGRSAASSPTSVILWDFFRVVARGGISSLPQVRRDAAVQRLGNSLMWEIWKLQLQDVVQIAELIPATGKES